MGNEIPRVIVKFTGSFIPHYASEKAAGCDIYADIENDVVIHPQQYCAVPTGIRLEIPDGYEVQVRPRSGLALHHGIGILNAPGTIDPDYRGEVKVILFNFGRKPFTIKRGDRIAQLVLARVAQAEFVKAEQLNKTERGGGGFGHTGR
jgi:dUTP pyrophosphatase